MSSSNNSNNSQNTHSGASPFDRSIEEDCWDLHLSLLDVMKDIKILTSDLSEADISDLPIDQDANKADERIDPGEIHDHSLRAHRAHQDDGSAGQGHADPLDTGRVTGVMGVNGVRGAAHKPGAASSQPAQCRPTAGAERSPLSPASSGLPTKGSALTTTTSSTPVLPRLPSPAHQRSHRNVAPTDKKNHAPTSQGGLLGAGSSGLIP